ncbi:trap-type c4-dicarboxylate transport system [Afipia carboxidovorans OM5]|uniref:TRAP transporter large permease protein n=1 Tax=Afipia carboxidovorans (strain ATCC 49405 / DSM 1227 / KCTC 32145 / OM5) TaxID=504832 RepID=B6JB34_AFIC5|nr:TRAP transporter large permease subunit [Afipia carboxidovorans]ACI92108.1 trap-type c4-dicarboxylate transport system [Afipia carboxidovorans OM5]AEI04043.1 TRAP transport system, large permease protein [Afipia carboxidovorans OM4]AEI07673.1 TRAP transport system, large permease protein [Afipia carboxidovorans OM5]
MDIILAFSLIGSLIVLLFFGLWVFAAMLAVSIGGLALGLGMPIQQIGSLMANVIIRYSSSWELAAIPMFIWMGEILFRTDISNRLFRGLNPLANLIPGKLIHTNVLGSALFACISGSSTATTATVGRITTSELARRKYDESLSLGSLAGSGSLGLLIPPSIVMIIYGVLAEVSIVRLFAAGILPGLVVASLFSGYIILSTTISPEKVPADTSSLSLREQMKEVIHLAPIVSLMIVVLGSLYTGFATPSEAAALGVVAALAIAAALRQLTFAVFRDSLMGAIRTSCMVCIILIAAGTLSTTMGYMHIPANVAEFIGRLHLSPIALLIVLSLFYVALGLVLDGFSMIVMSVPITLPLAMAAGFDPVWFGVYLVLMTELAQITPPVGFNLFVIQGLTRAPILRVALYAAPFFGLLCAAVILITAFPDIVLLLPRVLFG